MRPHSVSTGPLAGPRKGPVRLLLGSVLALLLGPTLFGCALAPDEIEVGIGYNDHAFFDSGLAYTQNAYAEVSGTWLLGTRPVRLDRDQFDAILRALAPLAPSEARILDEARPSEALSPLLPVSGMPHAEALEPAEGSTEARP